MGRLSDRQWSGRLGARVGIVSVIVVVVVVVVLVVTSSAKPLATRVETSPS